MKTKLLLVYIIFSYSSMAQCIKDENSNIYFPKTVSRWTMTEIINFEKSDPGLGTGVTFRHTSGSKGNLFIYDEKKKEIDKLNYYFEYLVCMEEIKSTYEIKGEIQIHSDSVDIILSDTLSSTLSSILKFQYTYENELWTSYLVMSVYKNKFIKIRISIPSEDLFSTKSLANEFANSLIEKIIKCSQ